MRKTAIFLAALLLSAPAAFAAGPVNPGGGPTGGVTTLLPVTAGDCAAFKTSGGSQLYDPNAQPGPGTCTGGGGGSGTVTSVSATPSNGITATVNNPTTTPALILGLGAITPTSVHASSSIDADGALLSGANSGNAGALGLFGSGTGEAIIQAPAAAGSVTLTTPTTGGTIASNVTAPVTLSTAGTIACATCGVTGSPLSQFAATTSAQLAGVISDETGTGPLVFGISASLTTPAIGAATGTSLSVTGQLTSTVATGTAPLAVTSTTNVANLNASTLTGDAIGTSGAAIPLLNGNNTDSGNNTHSGTNLFTGGAASITAGQATYGASGSGGAIVEGNGSSVDVSLKNASGTNVLQITHGTNNVVIPSGTLTVGTAATTLGSVVFESGSGGTGSITVSAPAATALGSAALTWPDLTGTIAINTPLASVSSTGNTFTAPTGMAYCTAACTITPPVPAAGYQFCVFNKTNTTGVITLAALGSSATYENQARTATGTAGTGTLSSGGAVADQVCIIGIDSTHYATVSAVGTWTAS